ncbi:MAG: transcriptional repressor [Candidatus Methanoplasma sp.]|jgi:Fur family ferric uptake transcriptional regulator/Fur family peroxide stress response transcriptional regulator|nr:transcriptional repressor [Candidatus Methanoplasma sp.]
MTYTMQRWTSQLSSILEIMYETEHFLSADQIYLKLAERDDSVGIATVYRNLKKLVDMGFISEVNWKDVRHYTKHPFSNAFFVCEKCGSMLRIDISLADQTYLSNEVGMRVNKWSMRFEGICTECEKCI